MVCVAAERLRDNLVELGFDLVDGFARCQPRSVADPEDVRVDREGFLAERRVEDNVGGLAADSRQRLQLLAGSRHLAAVIADQRLAERDDVLRLGVEQADGLDRLAQPLFAEVDHLLRSFDALEQRPGGNVDAGVGGLRRQHDRDEQLVGIGGFELGGRRGVVLRQPPEELENLGLLHNALMTSRIE